jgi:molecular chaperone DnaK
VHVAAKDMASGKEQSIKITASSGLNEEDIKRMVREAGENAEADKQKKERVTLKNNLDNLVYASEKLLKENGDKVPANLKTEMEGLITKGREAVTKDDFDAMKGLHDQLSQLSHKLAEEMYKNSAPSGGGTSGQPGGDTAGKKEDEPIEAEFREEKGQ